MITENECVHCYTVSAVKNECVHCYCAPKSEVTTIDGEENTSDTSDHATFVTTKRDIDRMRENHKQLMEEKRKKENYFNDMKIINERK